MLCKLAWGNVRRAGRDYLVYLLTLTLGVTVFYAFNTISMQVDIAGIDEEGLAQVMGSMLGDLTYFLAGVMAFLMVYANNFIMKRRKKEFGLYQVLGMGRGRVATIMALETVIVSVVAFVAGIVLGVGLSQLMTFFTASLFKTQIRQFPLLFLGACVQPDPCLHARDVCAHAVAEPSRRASYQTHRAYGCRASQREHQDTQPLDRDCHLYRGRGAGGRGLLPSAT